MEDLTNFPNNLNIDRNPLLLPSELDDIYKGNECLKFICINIRSFPKHHDDLLNLLSSLRTNFSCMVLTETFLKDYNKDLYTIPDYDIFHVYRKKRKGGGVSILVRKGLKAKETFSVLNSDIEAIGITFNEGPKTINLSGVYRPPQGSRSNFVGKLDELCNSQLNTGISVIAGDFNIDVSSNNINSYQKESLISTMTSNGFLNYINGITRPNERNNPTTIDHMWTNNTGTTKAYTICTDLSDHYPCILTFESTLLPQPLKRIEYRLISEERKHTFLQQVRNADFSFVFNDNLSIDKKFENFSCTLYDAYNENFPIRSKVITEKRIMNKWLTKALLNSIRQKHKLYKSAK